MIKLALDDDDLFAYLIIMIDHKHFFAKIQGQCLGLLLRLTWFMNGKVHSITYVVELFYCDPLEHGKSNDSTALKVRDWLEKYSLSEYQSKIKITGRVGKKRYTSEFIFCPTRFTGDYACTGTIQESLNKVGMINMEVNLKVCGSHNVGNFYKRTIIDIEDTQSRGDEKGN